MNIKCALIVGHRLSAKGAINDRLFSNDSPLRFEDFGNLNFFLQDRIINENYVVTEYDFSDILARLISQYVTDTQVSIIYCDDTATGYLNLPQKINDINPDFIVSLNETTIDSEIETTDMFYPFRCRKSKNIAKIFQEEIEDFFSFDNIGIKSVKKHQAGGHFLSNTNAPAIICKPFFMDNDYDLAKVLFNYNNFAKLYAKIIDKVTEEIFTNTKVTEFKATRLPLSIVERLDNIFVNKTDTKKVVSEDMAICISA